jgi:hypothetical protein
MQLYQIKATPESAGYGLMARDDEGYCYVYSANTGLWHRNGAREIDFEFDHTATYEPITGDDAAELVQGVKAADRRSMGRYVTQLKDQAPRWKKTSAEVGVMSHSGDRPISESLVELALARRKGSWTSAALYPIDKKRSAQKFVSDMLRKDRKAFHGHQFDARVSPSGQVARVELRPKRAADA